MLKTIDILARAKELTGKKFKCTKSIVNTSLQGRTAILELFQNGGELYYGLTIGNYKVSDLTGFEEWEKVQEPVDFMEAMKAYRDDKTIYCLLEDTKYTYNPSDTGRLDTVYDQCNDGLSLEEILDGKWYIKEDEK